MDKNDLIKTANLNWCIDIFKRIEKIINKYPDNMKDGVAAFDYTDIQQLKYLVKQGLHAEKKDE